MTLTSFLLQGAGQDRLGIYIKSVVKGGAADIVSNIVIFLVIHGADHHHKS